MFNILEHLPEFLFYCACNLSNISLFPLKVEKGSCPQCGRQNRKYLHDFIEKASHTELKSYLLEINKAEFKKPDENYQDNIFHMNPESEFQMQLSRLEEKIIKKGTLNESDAIYFMVLIRRYAESKKSIKVKEKYPQIKFFTDWAVHSQLSRDKDLCIKLKEINQHLSESLHTDTENELIKIILNMLDFSSLRKELLELTCPTKDCYPSVVLKDNHYWAVFCYRFLASVVCIKIQFPDRCKLNQNPHPDDICHEFYKSYEYAGKWLHQNFSQQDRMIFQLWVEIEPGTKEIYVKVGSRDLGTGFNIAIRITKTISDNGFKFRDDLKIF